MCILCELGGRGFHSTSSGTPASDKGATRGPAEWVDPAAGPRSGVGTHFDRGDFGEWFNGPRGGQGAHIGEWLGAFGRGPNVDVDSQLAGTVGVESPELNLDTFFQASDPHPTWDTGPGSGGDTIAGNTTSTEVLVLGAPAVTNYINTSGDNDFYQVTLVAGHYYEFTMNPEGTLDAVLEIRASNGTTILGSSDGPVGDETEVVGFFAQTSGTYWVNADGFTTSTGAYTLSVAEAPLPNILDSINWGGNGNVVPNSAVIMVYFAQAGEVIDGNPASLGWNAYEMQQMMLAFQQYSNVLNVTFQVTTNINEADFKLVTNNSTEFLGFFGPPNTGSGSGVGVFARNGTGWDEAGGGGLEQGGYGFVTMTHEIGHGMGLAHPHDNGGGSSVMLGVTTAFGSFGVNNLNQGLFTVMSYNNAWETGPNGDTPSNVLANGYMGNLGALDIALLQIKYGANTAFNAGDTNYTLATASGAGVYYSCIWDGGGADAINYAGSASAFIDLRAATIDYSEGGGGYVSYVTGVFAGFNIAQGVVIENASGGSGVDTIRGNSAVNNLSGNNGNDILRGDGGNDILNGGAGNDTFVFNIGDGTDTVTDFVAGGTDDSLQVSGFSSFTLVQEGANLRVVFDGSNSILLNNVLAANFTAADIAFQALATSGADSLTGTGGDNTIDGLGGNDTLSGLGGNDILLGNEGDDILRGGDGNDTLNGGNGSDTADYSTATAGVTINLGSGVAQNTVGAGSDTLTSVENALGTGFNDTLNGSSAANIISGGAGVDTITGAGGADIITGGLGNDSLNGGAAHDIFNFAAGDGVDTITSFTAGGTLDTIVVTGFSSYTKVQEGANLRIVFDASNSILLTNITAAAFTAADINIPLGGGGGPNVINGTAAGETLNGTAGIDQVNGLAGNDTLSGAGDNDTLNGGDNDDTLVGGLGADALNGDAGNDTADYTAAASAVTASLATNTASGGDGSDTFTGVENLTGSAFNDSLTGDGNANTLNGLGGTDTLVGGGGIDTLNGGDANDAITGGTGNDNLNGGTGNDTFNFGTGDGVDTITGFTAGGTDDTIMVTGYANYTLAQEGADLRVILDGSNSILLLGVTQASFTASDINIPLAGGGSNVINGTAAGEPLNGTAGVDEINGLAGNDTLNGAGDNDTLNGGENDDTLVGGLGADALNGGNGIDTADYTAAASAVTASLASNTATGGDGSDTFSGLENLTGSAFNDSLTGDGNANTLNGLGGTDTLLGGGAVDTINGGDANDTVTGGTGNDILNGGLGNDTFNFASGDGVDTITGFTAGGTDDTIVVTGFASYTLSQEGADLRVVLDASNSILLLGVTQASFTAADINIPLGGGGGSVINGTAGNDTLNGTSGAETINGLDGNDTLNGNGGADTLNGGIGIDILNGGAANDIINGGAGDDTMNGGAGSDTFLFNAGLFGADRIQQFNQGADKIQLSGIAGVDDFSDLVVTAQGGQGALVTFPDGSTILLLATTVGQVDASDFIFGP